MFCIHQHAVGNRVMVGEKTRRLVLNVLKGILDTEKEEVKSLGFFCESKKMKIFALAKISFSLCLFLLCVNIYQFFLRKCPG